MHPSWMIWNPITAVQTAMDSKMYAPAWLAWGVITFVVLMAVIAVVLRAPAAQGWSDGDAFFATFLAALASVFWPLTWAAAVFCVGLAIAVGILYVISRILLVPPKPQAKPQLPEPDPYLSIAQREVNAIAPDQQ